MIDSEKIIADILSKLSNPQFLKDVWINHKYWDNILNYDEAVNTLDDYYFFDKVEAGKIKFTDAETQKKLELFVKKLLEYDPPVFNHSNLNDTQWKEIMKISKQLLKHIDQLVIDDN